mmetsp:Transcript_99376/g.303858  ORF Transcript_99376/g.303858 Transcript_99376/m.303858 type:complete len:234 (-) Transcript_99376:1678-2379(-)
MDSSTESSRVVFSWNCATTTILPPSPSAIDMSGGYPFTSSKGEPSSSCSDTVHGSWVGSPLPSCQGRPCRQPSALMRMTSLLRKGLPGTLYCEDWWLSGAVSACTKTFPPMHVVRVGSTASQSPLHTSRDLSDGGSRCQSAAKGQYRTCSCCNLRLLVPTCASWMVCSLSSVVGRSQRLSEGISAGAKSRILVARVPFPRASTSEISIAAAYHSWDCIAARSPHRIRHSNAPS